MFFFIILGCGAVGQREFIDCVLSCEVLGDMSEELQIHIRTSQQK